MREIFTIFAAFLGTTVGSFLSAALHRLSFVQTAATQSSGGDWVAADSFCRPGRTDEDLLWGRSHCPRCGQALSAKELIPLVSFFWQRGRCRRCRMKISWRYPFLELATGGLFVLASLTCRGQFGLCLASFPLPLWWFFFAAALFIASVDYFYLVVPEEVLAATALVAIVGRGIFAPWTLGEAFLAAAVGGGFFWLIVVFSGEKWMGFGDAEVGALLGLLLGLPATGAAIILAAVVGGFWAIGLMLLGRKKMGDRLPFAPFLLAGGLGAFVGMPFWQRLFTF